ncbi:MAG: hypothetical protein IV092_00160 [Burkholderiaceae bacterium]|nr:hypothetical protein [Burkholderiaceae bacterium]
MTRNSLIAAAIATGAILATSMGTIAQTPAPVQAQTQQNIYGSQLMTVQERNEHQQQMRALKTQQERDQFRSEHHTKMLERAKERGVTLPDAPPARGKGAGPRAGNAPGMGAGPGSAPGGGKGR